MARKPFHLHTNRLNRGVNVMYLLIPTVVFIVVLAFLLFNYSKNSQLQGIATSAEPSILGEEAKLDNTFRFKAK